MIVGILYVCNIEWKQIRNSYFFQLPLALSKIHIPMIITSNLEQVRIWYEASLATRIYDSHSLTFSKQEKENDKLCHTA
jgi:hypothetical protein